MPITVLLETEWVLRARYAQSPPAIVAALRGFAGLPHVTVEDAALAARALGWMERGLDFADALHLAKSAGCEALGTFDRRLVQAAAALGTIPVEMPPPSPPPRP